MIKSQEQILLKILMPGSGLNFFLFSIISMKYRNTWKIQALFFHLFILDINIYGK